MVAAGQVPGPSEALFSAPPYSCVRNFYVSTHGNDNSPGTADSPWLSIQNADGAARQAGDCINVMPGTYPAGATVRYGGNQAAPTGYVVYRCTSLDACTITGTSGFTIHSTGNGPNYLMFDGFRLIASQPVSYGIGVGLFSDNGNQTPSSHHIWVMNNIIHGFGQSGVDMDSPDYIYYIHNMASGNAHVTCDAQGSGFTVFVPKATPNYTPTEADQAFGPYHIVYAWNISHNNRVETCGTAQAPYDTDGNGFIIDDFANQGSTGVLYPYQSLVFGNIAYHNGGAGILVARSSYVTVSNNTAFDDYLDPFNDATFRPEIGVLGGQGNTVVGNIAYSVPARSPTDPRCEGVDYDQKPWNPASCPLQENAAFAGDSADGITDANNVWSSNISYGGTPPYINESGNAVWSPDLFVCGAGGNGNACNMNPALASTAAANFALLPGSPAIGFAQLQQLVGFAMPDSGACAWVLTLCGPVGDQPPRR
jgi:parallel beta-helix repeat protein